MVEQEGLPLREPEQTAVRELTAIMQQHFPAATFAVRRGTEDSDEIFITAVVDTDDPDDVLVPIIDRLLMLQLDERIPVYVVPVHTSERIAETRRRIAVSGLRHGTATVPPSRPA